MTYKTGKYLAMAIAIEIFLMIALVSFTPHRVSAFSIIQDQNQALNSSLQLLLSPVEISIEDGEILFLLLYLASQGLSSLDQIVLLAISLSIVVFFLCLSCPLLGAFAGEFSPRGGLRFFTILLTIYGGLFCFALTRGPHYVEPERFSVYVLCLTYLLYTRPAAWQIFLLLNSFSSIRPDVILVFSYLAIRLSFEKYISVLIGLGLYIFNYVGVIESVRFFFFMILNILTLGFVVYLIYFLSSRTKPIHPVSATGKPDSLAKWGKRIPVLGVRGSGKSYFLCSLAYVVSRYGWGSPDNETSLYISDMLSYVLKGEPIPTTYKSRPISVELREVNLGDGKKKRLNIILSTEDYSGQEYEDAMKQLREGGLSGQLSGTVEKFRQMILNSKGIIIIVDLVGRTPTTPQEFEIGRDKRILNALSEQVSPLATGIELLLSSGKDISKKPFFFVFTKSDIHRLTTEQVSEHFDKVMAIPMSRLIRQGVIIKKYAVSSVGWGAGGELDRLHAQGFIELIMDIAKLVKG
ncbi:MAG: hypothetical protein QXR19_11280 [Candidatus Jordarchaeaceae archaeon]